MPSYLDFNSTASFRDFLISKTLQRPDGPQTFTATNYTIQSLPVLPNVDPGDVTTNLSLYYGTQDIQNSYHPDLLETIENLPIRNLLSINGNNIEYPYFTSGDHSLISILAGQNFDNESRLFKFAATNIRDEKNGPIKARITQNLTAATLGRVRLMDALNGNETTAINIITGREPLIEKNYKITVAKTLAGKAIDFMQTVAGVEFPWSEIPGDYLSNPRNPIENRPTPKTAAGAILQDVTGALGSLIGIQRRPKLSRKPSDLMIEYMGDGQKQTLFDNLSFSKYAPNYTTSARSQQSSKLFSSIDKFAQGVKNILGVEAPNSSAYIGDDRGDDVKYSMTDFNDNVVKSSYYLSLMFDPIQASLFERQRNVTEGGQLGSKLTWISKNSRNELGLYNEEYASESTALSDSLSTKYGFREDSILGKTQEILDSMPKDGLASRTHVGNVIDQTSRVFKEGEVMLSRGSAIQYVDKYTKETTGVEYCRVWTKDRAYFNYSDTMKRTGNIRKFDDSVMSTPWNLNIAPMSDGDRNFEGVSTNIFRGPNSMGYGGNGFYAKKYMFSIENLAWRTSNTPGFTYNDLPYCERGPNGGRVMWFPPYDLKISENNSARWTDNTFLGRPEPIYTYQDTSRTGQLSFKVVVDHPSVLNLLVREHFKNMSDEEAENYITAFFAGCQDLDFYSLIRRYTYLDADDIKLIQAFLNKGKDPEVIQKYRVITDTIPVTDNGGGNNGNGQQNQKISKNFVLKYNNDLPGPSLQTVQVETTYSDWADSFFKKDGGGLMVNKIKHAQGLDSDLRSITGMTLTEQIKKEKSYVFGNPDATIDNMSISEQVLKLENYFDKAEQEYQQYTGSTDELKQQLLNKKVQDITLTVESSCSSVATGFYNEKLSLRRSSSIINDFFKRIANGKQPSLKWISSIDTQYSKNNSENDKEIVVKGKGIVIKKEYSLRDFGYDTDGKLIVDSINYGENFTGKASNPETNCIGKEFYTVKGLKINAPIAFFCRQSRVNFEYLPKTEEQKKPEPTPIIKERLEPDGQIIKDSPTKKPAIDPMKRIIMKTLSECHYFKKLEEDSPVAFKSLKEKLKYFHPAFHSTTPEGLNSRLTFMLQAIRPGDTIPIKGIAEDTDINARNTTFGPPPVCVLRIGDFYHSKIIIRDVNISYDDSPWDLNPEGIGVQPMIATVTCSIAFIGGQGLSRPVERLQNALSSNFFANTEMYDERSIATNETIGGQKAEEFTKEFLEKLLQEYPQTPVTEVQNTNKVSEGTYLGGNGTELNYVPLVTDVYNSTKGYFESFEKTYNDLIPKYGIDLGTLMFKSTYRTINQYDVFTSTSTTPGKTLTLFGLHKKGKELPWLLRGIKSGLMTELETADLSLMFSLDKEMTAPKLAKSNEYITPVIKKIIEDKINSISESNLFDSLEKSRNSLITSLDKVNFVVKFGKDASVSGDTVTSATLSGFTYDLLYNEYEQWVTYIETNTPKMEEDLTSTIDFYNPTLTSTQFENILKVLLSDSVETIMKSYTDTILFPENLTKKIKKRVEAFMEKPTEKKFKFTKLKERKNSNEIKFTYTTATETNTTMIDEAKKVHSDNVSVSDKLNYYKKK